MSAVVVVPARDEERRVAACLEALARQGAHVVLVDDGSTDATVAVAERTAAARGLSLEVLPGPRCGVGHARRLGMAVAAERLRGGGGGVGAPSGSGGAGDGSGGIIASTDADSRVAPDWLARIEARIAAGAAAVGGRIELDPAEAAALPPGVLEARAVEAEQRLAAVREHAPDAEHHQFSGASLALTLAAHDAIGGLPAVAALEDEALERVLRAAELPIAYAADVRVTTSARTSGHVPRGLAQVLRTASWKAAGRSNPSLGRVGSTETVHRTGSGDAEAFRAAADGGAAVVVSLGPGVEDATALLEALAGDVLLAHAAEPDEDPLAELVARPALNLHAPELAVLTSPLTRTWAIRRELLETLPLPHGAALDLAVLLDTWTRHGLQAIAERPVAAPVADHHDDAPLAAYELLATISTRFPEPPPFSSAYASPAGTRRARLDELPPTMR